MSPADGSTVKPGDTLTYTLTFANTGDGTATVPVEIPDNEALAVAVDKMGNVYLTGLAQYSGFATAPFPTTLTPFPSVLYKT